MRVGIIGTGQMGSMLATAWLSAGLAPPLLVNTRTRGKAQALAREFPGQLEIVDDQRALADACDAIFVCAKAPDARSIIEYIAPSLRADQWLAATNSTTPLSWLESAAPCRTAKIIPSLTQYAHAGIVLIMPGERLTYDGADEFYDLISLIGAPYTIGEQQVRIYSDLTSCGPAFLADWLESMVFAAIEHGVPEAAARFLVGEMAYGVGQLVGREHFALSEIVDRVSVPGGVTSAGLRVLRDAQQGLFGRVFAATASHVHERPDNRTGNRAAYDDPRVPNPGGGMPGDQDPGDPNRGPARSGRPSSREGGSRGQ